MGTESRSYNFQILKIWESTPSDVKEQSGVGTQSSETHTEFAKELGLKEAIAIAVGAMIGGGIFSALGNLAAITGPSAVISFILGGIIAFLTSNSYYRLVNKYPSAGGEFVILRRGFKNPFIGNSIGIMLWLGYSVTIALYAFTFGNYTSKFLFELTNLHFFSLENTDLVNGRKFLSFLSIFIFMVINLRGVKETGAIQNVIVLFKVSVLLFVGVLGFILFNPDRYVEFTTTSDPVIQSFGQFSGIGGIIIGSAVVFVSYEGFQVIANTVEEMKNPARDVKIGMYISVIVVTLTYAVTTIATYSLVEDTGAIDETALISAVKFLGGWAVLLVTLGAAASTTSAINATLLGSSRLAYVMSDWKAFPKSLAVISKKTQVPWLAIIVTSLISWLFTFVGNAVEIAESGSIIFLGIFLTINLATLKVFPKEKNTIAKVASVLIVLYMGLVFYYFLTHWEKSQLAVTVLVAFATLTTLWLWVNSIISRGQEVDVDKYALEPLGKELINEFTITSGPMVDDFFINLDHILMPVSGSAFETNTWHITSTIARKYNAEVTLLSIGRADIDGAIEIFDQHKVKYNHLHKESGEVADTIIDTFNSGNYQLVCMASKRRSSVVDRLFDKSISKKVVSMIKGNVLQIHPPEYQQKDDSFKDIFLLFDGTERDVFLARWASVITSGSEQGTISVYHMVLIPQTISLEDAAQLPELKRSAENFEKYATDICGQLGLVVKPVFLFGHNFRKSLLDQIKKYEPDAVFIGHSRDKGLVDRIRTHLSYQILDSVPSGVIVSHTENDE